MKLKQCCREMITQHVLAAAAVVEGTRLHCPKCGTTLVYRPQSDAVPRWRVEQNGARTS